MQTSGLDLETVLTQEDMTESWGCEAASLFEEENNIDKVLHKMSQNVTVLLTILELSQMEGTIPPEDIDLLLDNSKQLRDYIRVLRSDNSKSPMVR
ncbi:MAG: hypothetical protein WCS37_15400 [Chloroflexota bacterium]|nr:hypothetical protein [Chloroflexota bacterium]